MCGLFSESLSLLLIYVSVLMLIPTFSVYCWVLFELRYCGAYSFVPVFYILSGCLRSSVLPWHFPPLFCFKGIANLQVALDSVGINNNCVSATHKYMFPWKLERWCWMPWTGVTRDCELPIWVLGTSLRCSTATIHSQAVSHLSNPQTLQY